MFGLRGKAVVAATVVTFMVIGVVGRSVHAELPPGYSSVAGVVPLNPSHVNTVGSEFTQICVGLPRPVQPGEVAWHFILPQSVLELFGPNPTNVFDTLTATFATAGVVTLDEIVEFGPPHQAHAYVYTSTDDTLTAGIATIGRRDLAPVEAANDSQFNLSHTCASTETPTTTTTTTSTTTPTTTSTTTTSTTSPTTTSTTSTTTPTTTSTTMPTTTSTTTPTTTSTTTTTDPGTTTTTTGGASPVPPTATTDPATTTTTIGGASPVPPTSATTSTSVGGGGGSLPVTGGGNGMAVIGFAVLVGGLALVFVATRRRSHPPVA